MSDRSLNRYAEFLGAAGAQVGEVDQVWWFKYNGFLRPAYLPHEIPAISPNIALEARRQLGGWFARWDSGFGALSDAEWWYVIRTGPYSMDQLSGNTRSKVRRGSKRLAARPVSFEEIRQQGFKVCESAVARYGNEVFMPNRQDFFNRLTAAEDYPDVCEFFGVFRGDVLVGFSENHVQGNGVFWESIWYEPDALRDYSSYLLTHAMLEHYLNDRDFIYASDGSRALYHDTDVQAFFMDKFGFRKEFAHLDLDYSPVLGALVFLIFPFGRVIEFLDNRIRSDTLARAGGLIRQEAIVRSCRSSTS